VAPLIAQRIRSAYVIGTGLALAAVGYGLLTQVGGDSALAFLVVGNMVMSTGFGLIFVLTSDVVVGAAPVERAGAASAIAETGSEFGGALGIAILGSLGTAVYRNVMSASIPAGIPAEAAEVAKDTLGGAVAIAHELPAQLGTALLDASYSAFAQGLHLSAIIATVLMVGTAILAVTMLRDIRPSGDHGSEHNEEQLVESNSPMGGNAYLEPALVPIACDEV
jgi:DHA2 family multidrug resistance protein-like MFS transporter